MHTLKALSFSYCSAKSTFQKGDETYTIWWETLKIMTR